MKVLHLTLMAKWFYEIQCGAKKTEYREIKPYWESRLEDRDFDVIEFKNGYHAGAKSMRVECLGITKNLHSGYYEIRLGRIL